LNKLAKSRGVSIWGVTKGLCGDHEIGRIFMDGGCQGLADSRLANIYKLSRSGMKCDFLLLRSPAPREAGEAVELTSAALVSDFGVLRALEGECRDRKTTYDAVLMLETGDLREGFVVDSLLRAAEGLKGLSWVRVAGVGTNLSCFGGVLPSEENLAVVARTAKALENILGYPLEVVSGGATTSVPMLYDRSLPRGINHLRVGSAMLRGAIAWESLAWLRQDTMELCAAWIEVAKKPSRPWGRVALDAFGREPSFDDRGERARGILAIGRQDVCPEGLRPADPGLTILGASSDHLVCDVEDMEKLPEVGDTALFRLNYAAMLAAATSPYVEKIYV
jgi:predicted amino acid racemase